MFPRHLRLSFPAFLAISVTLLLFGLLALLLSPHVTQAQTQPEALGSLRGVVRNAQGDPLSNITVWLQQSPIPGNFRQVTSNDAGVYEFPSLPSGTYTLRFEDASKAYATKYYVDADFINDATNVVVNGNDISNINMTLAPAGSISLTLQSSDPVSATNFSVRLYRRTFNDTWFVYREVYPEQSGRAMRFDALPAGNYHLCATLLVYTIYRFSTECYENVAPSSPELLAPNATDIQVQAGQERLITIDFEDNSQVEGTILSPGGEPLAGIDVLLYQEYYYNQLSVKTDENGRFRFPFVQEGNYHLVFNAPLSGPNAYLPMYYPNSETPANATTLLINADSHISLTRELRLSSHIIGKVVLPGDAPVAYAWPAVFRQWRDGTWHPFEYCNVFCLPNSQYDVNTGVFTITQLIGGNYRLGMNYALPGSPENHFVFYGGDSLETAHTLELARTETITDINFVVGEGAYEGVIAGRIMANEQPLAGIEVGLFLPYYYYYDSRSLMPSVTTLTDAEGRYSLEGLPVGYYIVAARDPNGMYATEFYQSGMPIDYTPTPLPGSMLWYSGTSNLDNINMTLTPGATLRGHVRIQHKQRGDFTVQAAAFDPQYPDPYYGFAVPYAHVQTDANGFYEITGLNEGTYFLRAFEPFGTGEYLGSPIFYPGTYDSYTAVSVTVATGETLENMDFWYYTTPTYRLPVIENGTATDNGPGEQGPGEQGVDFTPMPTMTPPVGRPLPTPTPDFN